MNFQFFTFNRKEYNGRKTDLRGRDSSTFDHTTMSIKDETLLAEAQSRNVGSDPDPTPTFNPKTASRVAHKLLNYGIERKLVNGKYLNFSKLEEDTIALLEKWEKTEYHSYEDIGELIDIWFPAVFELDLQYDCMRSIEMRIIEILRSEGYSDGDEE
jgi:hypothetical protein